MRWRSAAQLPCRKSSTFARSARSRWCETPCRHRQSRRAHSGRVASKLTRKFGGVGCLLKRKVQGRSWCRQRRLLNTAVRQASRADAAKGVIGRVVQGARRWHTAHTGRVRSAPHALVQWCRMALPTRRQSGWCNRSLETTVGVERRVARRTLYSHRLEILDQKRRGRTAS